MRRTISDVRAGVIESRVPAILNRRRRIGIIGGKGSRDRAHANLGRMPSEIKRPSGVIGARAPPITPTITGRRKVIIETIARSKTRLNLGRIPSSMGRPSGVIGKKAPAIVGRRRSAGIRRKPSKMRRPSGVIGARAPPRKVGVGREQVKIEDTEGGISAIVNSIMRMIFGK